MDDWPQEYAKSISKREILLLDSLAYGISDLERIKWANQFTADRSRVKLLLRVYDDVERMVEALGLRKRIQDFLESELPWEDEK